MRFAAMAEANDGRVGGDAIDAHVAHLEQNLPAVVEELGDQVLHHLLLLVDGDTPADQRPEIDVVELAAGAQENSIVKHALLEQARARADLDQEIVDPLLDQTGADAILDVGAAAVFKHDRRNSRPTQKHRQHEPGGPGADNADLSAHAKCSEQSTVDYTPCCGLAKAHRVASVGDATIKRVPAAARFHASAGGKRENLARDPRINDERMTEMPIIT